MVIAIDGHSSCGKSTLAKALAEHLGITYIDSGAMYRAVALYLIRNGTDIANGDDIHNALDAITIHFTDGKTFLNNENVSQAIRKPEVSDIVSEVSTISAIRRKLVELQRLLSDSTSVVMDGRDIGTVVFPDAELKLFVTASEEVRTERRYQELIAGGDHITRDDVRENLRKRDRIDSSRADSPLKQAEDAVLLDNSHMNRDEQLDFVINLMHSLSLTP